MSTSCSPKNHRTDIKINYIINQHDVYLHMKFGVISQNNNLATLNYVFMLGADLLKSVYTARCLFYS